METKRLLHSLTGILAVICAVAIFTCQTYGADSKITKTTEKTQVKKPEAKKNPVKTTPVKTANPASNPSSFKPDMPLREAIDILRNSTVPPLNIVVMWKDLDENADITRDTPIGMDGVSGVPLKTHLRLLLMSLSSGSTAQLGYIVDGNVIIIGTKDSLPKKMVTRVYDISDLVAPPSMAGMMPGMGMGIGMGMNMSMMPYGNMMYGNNMYGNSPYGATGTMTPYGNTGYPNQGYINQGQTNYNNQQRPIGIGLGF